jgi:hypothetical protein
MIFLSPSKEITNFNNVIGVFMAQRGAGLAQSV